MHERELERLNGPEIPVQQRRAQPLLTKAHAVFVVPQQMQLTILEAPDQLRVQHLHQPLRVGWVAQKGFEPHTSVEF